MNVSKKVSNVSNILRPRFMLVASCETNKSYLPDVNVFYNRDNAVAEAGKIESEYGAYSGGMFSVERINDE